MKRLSFKKVYIEPILDGSKRQTIRKASSGMVVGDVVASTCSWTQPPFAFAEVTKVQLVRIEDLTPEHAWADGFDSLEELHEVLSELYPTLLEVEVVSFSAAPAVAREKG